MAEMLRWLRISCKKEQLADVWGEWCVAAAISGRVPMRSPPAHGFRSLAWYLAG